MDIISINLNLLILFDFEIQCFLTNLFNIRLINYSINFGL